MAAPTNTSALTAINIGTTLPYSTTQTADDAGTTYDLWYAYTAQAGDNVIGVFGFGDVSVYKPVGTAWLGPAAAPVAYLGPVTGVNCAFQIPVTSGATYYFRFRPNAGNPTPATLTLSIIRSTDQAVPAGSIAINDDTDGFPLALLDATADNTVLQFVQGICAGEGGDILPSGLLLLEDISASDQLKLYSANYATIATISTPACRAVSQNKSDTFYVASRGAGVTPAVVRTVDTSGTLGSTWTLTGNIAVTGIAPSPNEQILYFIRSGANRAIQRWDLVNDVALADLTAGLGANTAMQQDLLCLDDGSVICMVRDTVGMTQVCKRFDAAGVLQNTYSLTYALSSTGGDRMAYGEDDTTFWVEQKGDPEEIGTVLQIRVSDGTVLTTRSYRFYESGAFQGTATATPDARFGPSFSCPFWITRGAAPAPTPTPSGPSALAALRQSGRLGTSNIVRIRRAPHLADEAERIFYSKFQLDCEAGVGTVTGQGQDPTLELRWSDDGGFTWSAWRTLGVGRQGLYRFRAIAWRLGYARDRVFEVRQSDPVKTAWLTAYLDIDGGAS